MLNVKIMSTKSTHDEPPTLSEMKKKIGQPNSWNSIYLTYLNIFLYIRKGEKGKRKGSPYSITECRVPELIPVLGSQPAGDLSHLAHTPFSHYFPPGPQLPSQPLRGLPPISLIGEQRHDGCEQFA